MSIITRMRKQTCVYWALDTVDQFGAKQYDSPVEISCRWEEVSEEYLDANGQRLISNAKVYVDRDMVAGSVLMLDGIASITNEDDVRENLGAYEIKRFDKLPNFKADEFLRTCYL